MSAPSGIPATHWAAILADLERRGAPTSGLEVVSGATEHHRSSGEVPEAEWSGRDQSGRLVFAMRGGLFARTDGTDAELASFTTQRPAPCPPPEWATRPLSGTSS